MNINTIWPLKFLFILFFATELVCAAPRIRIEEDELRDMYVDASRNTSYFEIEVDDPSGDGSSSSAPIKVYIPMTSGADQNDNFVRGANMPIPETTSGTMRMNVRVVNDSGESRRLYSAVQVSGDTYRIVGAALGVFNSHVDVKTKLVLNLASLCNESQTTIDCSQMAPGSVLQMTKTALVYFFVAGKDDNFAPGTEVDIGSYSGGIYTEVNMSNQIPTASVDLQRVSRGDGRLELFYEGQTFNNFFEAFALYSETLPNTNNVGAEVATGNSFSRQIEDSKVKGSLLLNKLENGVSYYVGVGLASKFGFGSLVSNYINETPVEIEELLKSHSCFLLTAGFKRDHKVIEGFKWVRDHIISAFWPGEIFIKAYYKYSPHVARIVYASEKLSSFVRAYATAFYYGVIALGFFIFGGALVSSLSFLIHRKSHTREQ